ncbi:hypothetical protein ABZ858_00975 [Streptomyces sp. NPDC047017]|uniref:hypothetical protein n=1 Tax=Streptomyces sp. NPDC047017 TaxID=3155024 RepID=UPI0033F53454
MRLRVDPLEGTSRQVLAHESVGQRYDALCVGVPEAAWDEVPTGDLIAYLRAALNEG